MPWASARTVRAALAVRSLHRVKINKHLIQRKAIGSVYREKAISSLYREKLSQGKDLNTRGLEFT
ncbi:hypothetical protein MITS9508_00995 [Synechococcus sp. MIT S9508]|nr:hypothetical protein MITS9508_00995 [Synechococcus sp. MIT S9508]